MISTDPVDGKCASGMIKIGTHPGGAGSEVVYKCTRQSDIVADILGLVHARQGFTRGESGTPIAAIRAYFNEIDVPADVQGEVTVAVLGSIQQAANGIQAEMLLDTSAGDTDNGASPFNGSIFVLPGGGSTPSGIPAEAMKWVVIGAAALAIIYVMK